jgi:N-dimethylarginine dimethylaminohydrolase
VAGAEGLPDMVFCANQTLPYIRPSSGNGTDGNNKGVVLSQMYAPQRKSEVSHYSRFFEESGYDVLPLDADISTSFEGMGDAIWHPSRYLLWGGYGFRTDASVYSRIAEELDVHVLILELTDPDFYHLDTCFSALNEETVLIYPDAFHTDGLALIRKLFQNVLESPEDEARRLFSCNAHCPDGQHVLIQSGCTTTNGLLKESGFDPVELDTSEFLKAGGSVFCMKQMFW